MNVHFLRRWLPFILAVTSSWPGSAIAAVGPPSAQPSDKDFKELVRLNDRINKLLPKGSYWEAEKCSLALLTRLKPLLDNDAPEMWRQRLKLGTSYHGQGLASKARDLLGQSVSALRRHTVANSPDLHPVDFPQALYRLARLDADLQRTDDALREIEEALRLLYERKLDDDPLTARVLTLRGALRSSQSDDELARRDFLTALRTMERAKNAQAVASLHQCIAVTWIKEADQLRFRYRSDEARRPLAEAQRHLEAAEQFCGEVQDSTPDGIRLAALVEIARAAFDASQRDLRTDGKQSALIPASITSYLLSAQSLAELNALRINSHAMSRLAVGDELNADKSLSRAITILKSRNSPNQRLMVLLLMNQAMVRGAYMNRVEEATEEAGRALDLLYDITLKDLAFQSIRQQQLTSAQCEGALTNYLSLAMKANRPAAEIYRHVFRWKGLLFARGDKRRLEPAVRSLHFRLASAVAESRRAFALANEAADAIDLDRRNAREALEQRERELSAFLRDHPPTSEAAGAPLDLASALKPGTVFLDYAAYLNLSRAVGAPRTQWTDLRFVVFIIRAGESGITMIPLPTPLGEVNRRIVEWRKLLPVAASNQHRERELRALSADIANALWRPVEPHCRGARLLWVCPTELLWAFPFSALPDNGGDYLIRRFAVAYAVSARQALQSLVPVRQPAVSRGPGVIVSGIEYGDGIRQIRNRPSLVSEFSGWLAGEEVVPLTGPDAKKDAFLASVRKFGSNVCFVGHGIWSLKERPERSFFRRPIDIPRWGEPQHLTADPFQFRIPLAGAQLARDENTMHLLNATSLVGQFQASTPIGSAATSYVLGVDQSAIAARLTSLGRLHLGPTNSKQWVSPDEFADAAPPNANRCELWMCSGLLGPSLLLEGLISFPRALLLGGYRTVVAGQWAVQEHAALAFIPQLFHEGVFGQSMGEAFALQRAQCAALDYGGANASPFHWAAWVVIGEPGLPPSVRLAPPRNTRQYGWFMFGGGGAILVLIIIIVTLVVVKRRNRRVRSS
jgi:CHAT domain-containing protein